MLLHVMQNNLIYELYAIRYARRDANSEHFIGGTHMMGQCRWTILSGLCAMRRP